MYKLLFSKFQFISIFQLCLVLQHFWYVLICTPCIFFEKIHFYHVYSLLILLWRFSNLKTIYQYTLHFAVMYSDFCVFFLNIFLDHCKEFSLSLACETCPTVLEISLFETPSNNFMLPRYSNSSHFCMVHPCNLLTYCLSIRY